MPIILNADDFGHCDDTVRATIECFDGGALSSATIMPRMPATGAAINFARAHPQFSFGIHLTFVGDGVERPFSDPGDIPALCASDGQFCPSQTVRLLALISRIPQDQIEREMEAQIGYLIDHRVPLSHVDSHGHLHKFAPFVRVMRRVLPKFGITKVRTAQDTYIRRPLKSPTYWYGRVWRRRLMEHFRTTHHMFMATCPGDARELHALLPWLSDDTIEIGVHPGYAESWRDAERVGVKDLAARAESAGHRIITWNDL